MTPIPDDELEVAADVIENFTAHWVATKGDLKAQQALIQLIVARVWVEGERVVGMSLRPNYHITVGLDNTKPTEIEVGSRLDIMSGDIIIPRRGRRCSLPSMYKVYLLPPLKLWWRKPPTGQGREPDNRHP